MRVGISQPEHFPYLGYFQKMSLCDVFVLLDSVQFSGPRSWQNRNRYTDCNDKSHWFTVPVAKNSYHRRINEVRVALDNGWRQKLIKKMSYIAPGVDFGKIYQGEKLVDINIRSIKLCCERLGLDAPILRSSELDVGGKKQDLIYDICRTLGADVYVSGQGSKDYLKGVEFDSIEIAYLKPELANYDSTVVFLRDRKMLEQGKKMLGSFCLEGK